MTSITVNLLEAERAIARAWPPDEARPFAGWLWRASGGGFGRANSVATLGAPPADIDGAIDEIEALYRGRRLTPVFQVTDASLPGDLEQRLTRRGYINSEINATLATALGAEAAMSRSPATAPLKVEIDDAAGPDWIETYAATLVGDRRLSAPRILARVPRPRRMIGVRNRGVHIATVLVVADGPIAVIECVATRPEARRTGAARFAMLTALDQARLLGSTSIALGVVAANAPARALYASLGFEPIGQNRYFSRHP
jgi:N-acetylglutamate synthase